uniref:Uncharacterized protein n=1 Tax=Elaeophora elaphi TaxID=1147741 RepID=A0A0R3S5H5_9BILA
MRSEILTHLLVSLLSAIAQNVESENSTIEAISLPTPSQTVQLISKSQLETTSLSLGPSFPIQKFTETIAPRERGFPFPELKTARELGALKFEIPEQESSTTSPFNTEIDRSTTSQMQSDHSNYQNATQEE